MVAGIRNRSRSRGRNRSSTRSSGSSIKVDIERKNNEKEELAIEERRSRDLGISNKWRESGDFKRKGKGK